MIQYCQEVFTEMFLFTITSFFTILYHGILLKGKLEFDTLYEIC